MAWIQTIAVVNCQVVIVMYMGTSALSYVGTHQPVMALSWLYPVTGW